MLETELFQSSGVKEEKKSFEEGMPRNRCQVWDGSLLWIINDQNEDHYSESRIKVTSNYGIQVGRTVARSW